MYIVKLFYRLCKQRRDFEDTSNSIPITLHGKILPSYPWKTPTNSPAWWKPA